MRLRTDETYNIIFDLIDIDVKLFPMSSTKQKIRERKENLTCAGGAVFATTHEWLRASNIAKCTNLCKIISPINEESKIFYFLSDLIIIIAFMKKLKRHSKFI